MKGSTVQIINIESSTKTVHLRTVAIDNGPTLQAGPLYRDDIEFIVDTVEIKWEEGSTFKNIHVSGYRVLSDGRLNKSYRHHKTYKNYSEFPKWLTEVITETAIRDTP